MQILNVTVEQVGTSRDGRNLLVGRGHDAVRGWRISFLVPSAHRDHVLREVRGGRRPMISVPEVDALPWAPAYAVEWE